MHGTGLRPTLRAAIGDHDAVGFLFETPTTADVLFGDLGAGTYDLVLYDGVQEVARARNAVTVPRKPTTQMVRVLAIVWTCFICVVMVMPPNELTGKSLAAVILVLGVVYSVHVRKTYRGPEWVSDEIQ